MKTTNSPLTLLAHIEQQLQTIYDDEVLRNQYAWWTLETITGYNKATLLVQQSIALSHEQQSTLQQWLDALVLQKKPIQYLLGSVPFAGVTIMVKPPILIPRPETEEWCVALGNQLLSLHEQRLTILDLCCGSGCIGIALAKALPHATIYSLDIDIRAVELTKENANYNGVANVIALQSDLFEALPNGLQFDMIISNPPYITPEEWIHVDDSVKKWESEQALLAQDHGLEVIKKIVAHAPEYIRNNESLDRIGMPQLILEIGYAQGKMVANLFKHASYSDVTIHQDMQGHDRVVSGRAQDVAITDHPE